MILTRNMLCMYLIWQSTKQKTSILIWCDKKTCVCRWNLQCNFSIQWPSSLLPNLTSSNWMVIATFCWTLVFKDENQQNSKGTVQCETLWRCLQQGYCADSSKLHTSMQLGYIRPTRYALGGNLHQCKWNACRVLLLVWSWVIQNDKDLPQ